MPEHSGKETKLEALLTEIRACRVCAQALPHAPRPVLRLSTGARILVCGQAPGTRVHASGIPFTDPSGVRLRAWMGVSDEEFYDIARVAVIPMGLCFPGLDKHGGDLPPQKECAPLWRPRLAPFLSNVRLTLAVGSYAQQWFFGDMAKGSMTDTVKAWRAAPPDIVPLPHPSWRNNRWVRDNPWFEDELLPVLRAKVRAALSDS